MRFLPFKVYTTNYGNLTFLYYEEITFSPVFIDEIGEFFIFDYPIYFEENPIFLN
jgi:hypothetical protein